MCGSVGLFIGCAALSGCPRHLIEESVTRPSAESGADADTYRSPFARWDDRSSVRSAPRQIYTLDDAQLPPIATELVPVADDPRVRALPNPRQRTVLLRHLYRYLRSTVALESLVVNRVVLGIANGWVGVELPREMRLDAYKIYCDEAYHALFSADLCQQIEAATGMPAEYDERPYFLTRLEDLLVNHPDPVQRPMIELLFVIVSETLISATLADWQSASPMASSVRGTLRAHAVDEGRHHAYFARFLRRMWPQLSAAEQRLAGRMVPRLIDIFLAPDSAATCADLVAAGLSRDEAEAVVTDIFAPERIAAQQNEVGRQTLQHFAELGAFSDQQYDELTHDGAVPV